MSLLPMKRICPRCGRQYDFNPDVGKIFCPRCRKKAGSSMEICPVPRITPESDRDPQAERQEWDGEDGRTDQQKT